MPSREMRSGVARVSSCPRKRTLPEVARSSPAIRFRKVDLPAPLGPITACASPSRNESETPSTAASAPKRRERFSTFSRGSATGSSQQSREPARKEEHDRDHERADERVPVRGELLAVMFEEGEQHRSQHRTEERSLAAEQHRHEQETRLPPAEMSGVDEPIERGVEVSREPCQRAGQDEGDELVAGGRIAQ